MPAKLLSKIASLELPLTINGRKDSSNAQSLILFNSCVSREVIYITATMLHFMLGQASPGSPGCCLFPCLIASRLVTYIVQEVLVKI